MGLLNLLQRDVISTFSNETEKKEYIIFSTYWSGYLFIVQVKPIQHLPIGVQLHHLTEEIVISEAKKICLLALAFGSIPELAMRRCVLEKDP